VLPCLDNRGWRYGWRGRSQRSREATGIWEFPSAATKLARNGIDRGRNITNANQVQISPPPLFRPLSLSRARPLSERGVAHFSPQTAAVSPRRRSRDILYESPPLRAFPRERATRAEKSPGTTGADRRKALPLPSIIRPSRFPWPRKSPRDWKCSRRRCDDREEGRDARARASERGERPSWKPGADGRAFDRPSA